MVHIPTRYILAVQKLVNICVQGPSTSANECILPMLIRFLALARHQVLCLETAVTWCCFMIHTACNNVSWVMEFLTHGTKLAWFYQNNEWPCCILWIDQLPQIGECWVFNINFLYKKLGVIHKQCWQVFGFFWPPTHLCLHFLPYKNSHLLTHLFL